MSRPECEACGAVPVLKNCTFSVVTHDTSREAYICRGCWTSGTNGEDWNDRITQAIIARSGK